VVERLAPSNGRVYINLKAFLDLRLADELCQTLRPKRELHDRFFRELFWSGDLGARH
jgi:hypothetical protein